MFVVSFCRLVAVVGAAGLVLAACSGDDAVGLTDSPWRASQYVDASGALVDPGEDTVLSATFDGEQVAGSAGCNNYFGGYTTDGDAISFGPLAGDVPAAADVGGGGGLVDHAAIGSFPVSHGGMTVSA